MIKIISGQQLPKPPDSMLGDRGEVSRCLLIGHFLCTINAINISDACGLHSQIIDPFVEVEIIGLPSDCCKEQTRVVDDNGMASCELI